MDTKTLSWLAGLLEGEGSFMAPTPSSPNQPIISVQMCDEDVIARVAGLFERSYCEVKKQADHHKRTFRTQVRGKKAVALMVSLKPLMGKRRKSQIDSALLEYNPNYMKDVHKGRRKFDRENMKKLRSDGLSDREIARRIGCSHPYIAKAIGRKNSFISVSR